MRYMRAMLLGVAMLSGSAAFAGAQVVLQVQRYDHDDHYRDWAYVADFARRMGRQDGVNDGANDRRTGHSFRPTHDTSYKHADTGYAWRFGNKNDYKAFYREGYTQGYEQGYNRGAWQRR
jgi:hypothetical protein